MNFDKLCDIAYTYMCEVYIYKSPIILHILWESEHGNVKFPDLNLQLVLRKFASSNETPLFFKLNRLNHGKIVL